MNQRNQLKPKISKSNAIETSNSLPTSFLSLFFSSSSSLSLSRNYDKRLRRFFLLRLSPSSARPSFFSPAAFLLPPVVCLDQSPDVSDTMSNHVSGIPGSPEESYKMMYSYLYMLKQVNPGTKTCVKLDDASKFKYLFIALGACIEGFAFMRKVIAVDATSLKNRYGGVLVFAEAQDPNGQSYPLAFAVLDSENLTSWTWFFEMLKSVIPDSSELVFMSERNQSLIFAIGSVFPEAHHGHCLWHLKEKVKWHAGNVNKVIVGHRFMELGRYYTVDDFNSAYDSFEKRYPAVYKYVQEHTEKDKWARVFFHVTGTTSIQSTVWNQ
ncbi:protein FAR-RED ELONGATED HYPOCOTYL 3-like [Raphanus sativus]|uniref:Protein FAR-RED ELONGATED HYPOCOTYL 3-like n=1 Tax=Raphanus sativus TaxID=3726 RepID=A0A9W3DKA9_RAPSA|nr:protein FAR-RED ELONGATED HYPOCOTYL 3-like [Raphanus sativus]